MDLDTYLHTKREVIEKALQGYLPPGESPSTISRAMRYSVFAGGKRLRPILTLATAEIFTDNPGKEVIAVACAIELIHTYSLIHDDLPAMDNDDYRRGRLTNHKVFGEAMAILAGDALLTRAFEIMASCGLKYGVDPALMLRVIAEVGKAAGVEGMVGGQVIDLESEGKTIEESLLQDMHARKTGALICASVRAGGILTGASEVDLDRLTGYAKRLGLAFQIVDDILDLVGDETKMGKKTGGDKEHGKATYPGIYGLDKCWEKVRELYKEAVNLLFPLGEKAKILRLLADKLVYREY